MKRNCGAYGRSIRVVGVSIMHGAENRTEHRSVTVGNGLSNVNWSSGREVEW
ncbi:hypothetical protein GPK90_04950 [Clostridium sp. MCC344]|nr:hypothetical protein [Clostridium sp. MCC344]MBT9788692.1 hypothetical protein [Clostridium sp. MCC344]